MADKLNLDEDIIDRLDARTKRTYVRTELVNKPIDHYKGMVKRISLSRIKDLEDFNDEIIQGLYAWTAKVHGRRVPDAVGRAAAVEYIIEGIRTWAHQETRRGAEASTGPSIGMALAPKVDTQDCHEYSDDDNHDHDYSTQSARHRSDC